MQHLLRFTILMLCATVLQLFGCSENTDTDIPEEVDVVIPETTNPEPIVTTSTPETIFERLQNQFAGRLDNKGNFTGIRNVTTSQTYLDFLAEAYPTEKPVQTLEEYFQVAPPDMERYTPFLKKWIDNPTDEDIIIMHRITVAFREADFILFKTLHLPKREEIGVNVWKIFEKKMGVFAEPAVEEFMRRYQLEEKKGFAASLHDFVVQTEKIDALWLHEQLEEHRTDNGLLWSAIQKPSLVGEILQNFSLTDDFLLWIDKTKLEPDMDN